MAYEYTPLNDNLYPTIANAKSAIKKADNLDPKQRDIRDLMSILFRVSKANPKIAGNILTRRTALTSYKWDIKDPTGKETALPKILNKVINKALHYYLNAPLYNACLMDLEWALIDNSLVPKIIKNYKPFEIEKDNEKIFLLQPSGDGFIRVELTADNNKIYAVDESDWTGGILRSCMYYEILRNEMVLEWANFNKKIKGLIQAKVNDVKSEGADAAAALQAFTQKGFSITNKETEFLVNSMADYKGLTSFKDFIDKMETYATIAILGQANTTELPASGGSRAALDVLKLISIDFALSDMKGSTALIDMLLLNYYRMNYESTATMHPYEFTFLFDEDVNITTNVNSIEMSINNGIPLVASDVYNKLGLMQPTPEDTLLVVTPKTTQPAF